LIGPNSFEIKFSEPVQSNSDAEVLVNDGTYYVSEEKQDYRTLTVELGVSSLNEGTYKVKVKGYRDYAGNIMRTKTFDLEYVKDTTPPTAKVKEATQKAALTRDYFYHTYSSWKPTKVVACDYPVYLLSR